MILGRIKLSPGRAGFYDELTRIHLTISRPEANVYYGMNTENLKIGVAYGTLKLISGTLDENSINKPIVAPEPVKVVVTPIEEPKIEEETEVTEPVVEQPNEKVKIVKEDKTSTKSKTKKGKADKKAEEE